jgi:hypothetical protein
MPIYRYSMVLAVTTVPQDPAYAIAHSGGWSEGHWSAALLPTAIVNAICLARAACLPAQCSVVGYKQAVYSVSGNKLTPQGTSTVKKLFAGNKTYSVDVPQAGLRMSATSAGVPNAGNFTMRGTPDEVIVNGEFNGSAPYGRLLGTRPQIGLGNAGLLQGYAGALINNATGFLGRNLTLPARKVQKIAAGVVTLDNVAGIVAGTDFLIFKRVRDANGDPVSGSFLVTNIAGNLVTLQGLNVNTAVNVPSGTARVDQVSFYPYSTINLNRAVVKKIGLPTERYRGRRSRRRV